jgi:LysR family transcriptional regulator, glycine cleavage system transcriptional activator
MPDGFTALPSLNALRVFEVVARHLNFRLGAQELGVTQAAVAQQVRALEASLDIRLFERLPRGLRLTEAGRRYSASVREALALLQEATLALRPQPSHLTVSVTPTFAAKWLIPKIDQFSEAYPQVDLRVLATDKLSHFHTDGIDLAVRYGRPPFGPGLEAQLLMVPKVVAVASPRTLAEHGRPRDLDHLQAYLLLHDAHNAWPAYMAQLFRKPAQPMTRNLRFNQTALAIEAAISGTGIALASDVFVEADLRAGRLVKVFDLHMEAEKAFYLVWPRKPEQPPTLSVVVQWLLGQAQAQRPSSQ